MATTIDQAAYPQDEDIVLEMRNVSVSFGMSRGESRVLNNVDLTVRRDETLGVIGESGSGKSMCAFSLLDAIEEPGVVTGDVTYYPEDGEPIDVLSLTKEELNEIRWEEIAMVSQAAQTAFNPSMKIGDHFRETVARHGRKESWGIEHGHELLAELHLPPESVMDSYPHELSGGMKQRALIALALVLEPNVLILDEPTASLDLLMQRSIISLLDSLKQQYDFTMVFVTHDLPLIKKLADRLAVMYAFEIAEIGPTEQIVGDANHPYTRALINSVPNISSDVDAMHSIPGSSPDPVSLPRGCSYHPRCPLSDEFCEQEDPSLQEVTEDSYAACHYADQAAEAVPLTGRVADTTRFFNDLTDEHR